MCVCVCVQVMYARHVDQRSAIFQKVLEVGEAYQLRTKVRVCVLMSLLCQHVLKGILSHAQLRLLS